MMTDRRTDFEGAEGLVTGGSHTTIAS